MTHFGVLYFSVIRLYLECITTRQVWTRPRRYSYPLWKGAVWETPEGVTLSATGHEPHGAPPFLQVGKQRASGQGNGALC